MADLAGVFNLVSRAATLTLQLYIFATTAPSAVNSVNRITKSITSFSSTVKQLGTIIREDDSLPSSEAIEILDDVLNQCNSLFTEIESKFPISSSYVGGMHHSDDKDPNQGFQLSFITTARLGYLTAHLDSLKSTLSVMLQTMHTAQSVIWAKTRPTISPQQAATAVANERAQLEALIIEQQMSILAASTLYTRPDSRLLMEDDCSKSLVPIGRVGIIAKPAGLFRYQETYMASLDSSETTETDWLLAVCGVSRSHLEHLLRRWTRLHRLEERINDDERKMEAQRRETLQPTVESDMDDEVGALPKLASNHAKLNNPTPQRPGSIQPLFAESTTLPISVPDSFYGPAAPLSPASSYGVSPRSSGHSLPSPSLGEYSSISPRFSISTLPVEAAAAVEAKDNDDDLDLEIPWTLCSGRHYWKYVDGKIVKSNTDAQPPTNSNDRNAWTELLPSWVCKEAIREVKYNFTQVQKDRMDGRRTKFETCFCIQQPLSFNQVQSLVERTVELYRQNRPPSPVSPPPNQRRTSFDRLPLVQKAQSHHEGIRTPLANQRNQRNQYQPSSSTYPPLDRSSSFSHPPPPPPPLDRSLTMPGTIPTYPSNPHPATLHIPNQPNLCMPQATAYSPKASTFSPQVSPYSPSFYPPPGAPYFPSSLPTRAASNVAFLPPPTQPQLPRRSSHTRSRYDEGRSNRHEYYSSTSTTSDEENDVGRRKHRSRSRRPSSTRRTKHSTVGTLAKVGGLAALLDGIVELGVL